MKNVLITGAAGLLGQFLVKYLITDYNILVIDITESPFSPSRNLLYLQADLTDFKSVRGQIARFQPSLIYNCAAHSDVDDCEINKTLADRLNIDLVENLLSLPFQKLIHFSSDYVFNGHNGPYSETDLVDPLGYYGWTKMRSEKLIQESPQDHLIIRTNVLYGRAVNCRPNFLTWLIDSLRLGLSLRIVDDQFNNPIYAGNLAAASIEAAESNYSGILHIGGADYLSRYDIAVKAAAKFELNQELIKPVSTAELNQRAPRPLKAGLRIEKAVGLLKTKLLSLDEGLDLAFEGE